MKYLTLAIVVSFLLGLANYGAAFQAGGCGEGECKDCHQLSKDDASALLKGIPGRVTQVKFCEVPGLWVVDLENQDKIIPVYIDFSKKYLITGRVVRLATREDLTEERFIELNRIDVSTIPLENALVIGNPTAPRKIIVFEDPECSYCRKLYDEMQDVVAKRSDIAFYIKMFPLQIHPKAYEKAKAILCKKSVQLLEDSLNGKDIPPPTCETDQVDRNLELGRKLNIRSTPTLIFPDGRVIPGYKSADRIIELLAADNNGKKADSGKN